MSILSRIKRLFGCGSAEEEDCFPVDGMRYYIQTPVGNFPASHFLVTEYGIEFLYEGVLSVYFSQHQTLVHDFESGVTGSDFEAVMKEAERQREEFKKNVREKMKQQQQVNAVKVKAFDRERDVV